MFVVEATKSSKRKKNTLELHYRVWRELSEQERVEFLELQKEVQWSVLINSIESFI